MKKLWTPKKLKRKCQENDEIVFGNRRWAFHGEFSFNIHEYSHNRKDVWKGNPLHDPKLIGGAHKNAGKVKDQQIL